MQVTKYNFLAVAQTPYLNCPVDLQITLDHDKKTVVLGALFPQPQSNIPITHVSHTQDHAFPVGLSVVRFEGVSDDGVTKSCDVIVDVKG